MKQLKAYKFRMYPSVLQQELINKTIGCTRLVYNIMLGKKKDNSSLSKFDLMREIPSLVSEYPFLREVDSMALRCAITDLDNGFKRYYSNKYGKLNEKKLN